MIIPGNLSPLPFFCGHPFSGDQKNNQPGQTNASQPCRSNTICHGNELGQQLIDLGKDIQKFTAFQ